MLADYNMSMVEKTDEEYAAYLQETFQVDTDAIVSARREGRGIAARDRQLERKYNGEMAARAYRTLALPVDSQPETSSLLEHVFLVAYTSEYYRDNKNEEQTQVPEGV